MQNNFHLFKVLKGAKDFVGPSEKSSHSVISSVAPYQRRGSVPCETNVLSRTSANGKRRNPKKILRRRSSSGAEILTPIVTEGTESTSSHAGVSVWNRFKKEFSRPSDSPDVQPKRRGSLPIDVLTFGLGKNSKFTAECIYVMLKKCHKSFLCSIFTLCY